MRSIMIEAASHSRQVNAFRIIHWRLDVIWTFDLLSYLIQKEFIIVCRSIWGMTERWSRSLPETKMYLWTTLLSCRKSFESFCSKNGLSLICIRRYGLVIPLTFNILIFHPPRNADLTFICMIMRNIHSFGNANLVWEYAFSNKSAVIRGTIYGIM